MDEAIIKGGKTIYIPEDIKTTVEEIKDRSGKKRPRYCCIYQGRKFGWYGNMWMEITLPQ